MHVTSYFGLLLNTCCVDFQIFSCWSVNC